MSSRSQKQAAHQQKKQRKAAERARKQKRTALREKVKEAQGPRHPFDSQEDWMERRMELLEQQKQWLSSDPPRCGLCGATKNLTKTECCDQWICDDEHTYQLFSFARNSCSRNHRRYTICGGHFEEGHPGRWQDCPKCRNEVEPEMYAHWATNEYNFEILENPPEYEPTHCASCGRIIVLADGGYSYSSGGYRCGQCTAGKHPGIFD